MSQPAPREVPVFTTERLVLRGFRDADREPFAALNYDPLVTRYLQGPLTRDRSDAFVDRIVGNWGEHGWGLWALEVRGSGEFIGYTGLAPVTFLSYPAVEIGWRLASSAWGNGYAPEAAREALRFAFEIVGLDEVVSFTARVNLPSIRVMEKIRLRHDPARDFDHPRVDADAYPELVAHCLYAISAVQWAAD